ncbi:MAG: ornithine cyclodeaminase [Alphaproteobacteria bacterium]|nr:ornithine cyclodeaminase [Alphaproteobacteria bacterium]
MRFIDARQVYEAGDFSALMDALERDHQAPVPMVERVLLETEARDKTRNGFLIWPAWQPGEILGAKLVTIFPGNDTQSAGVPSVQAIYNLFDGGDGRLLAAIDGTALTYLKTAADSALGARFLARRDSRHLVMVGAGALAPHLIEAHLISCSSVERVTLWNRTAERAVALCDRLVRPGLEVTAAEDLEESVRAGDIICCATMAQDPLIQAEWLAPGSHLDLVGSFTTEMAEAAPRVAAMADVYVDTRWFTVGHCGDLDRAIEQGLMAPEDIRGDLFELCAAKVAGRISADQITMFKNAGGAHLDLMTARFLWEKVRDQAPGHDG